MTVQSSADVWPVWATRAVLVLLVPIQCAFAWNFWRSYAPTGEWSLVLPLVGVGLAILEVFALVVAGVARTRGDKAAAATWRFVWVVLFVINLTTEIGAFSNVIHADDERRSEYARHTAEMVEREGQLDAEIAALTAELETRHADKPVAALQIDLRAARAVAASFATPRIRDVRDIGRLESAIVTAETRAARQAERDRLASQIAQRSDTASVHSPQLVTLARLLNAAGFRAVRPEDVEAFLPLGLALVLKLVLTFGFWVTTPTRKSEGGGEGAPASPPTIDATPPNLTAGAPLQAAPVEPLPPAPDASSAKPQPKPGASGKPKRNRPSKRLAEPPKPVDLEPLDFVFDEE